MISIFTRLLRRPAILRGMTYAAMMLVGGGYSPASAQIFWYPPTFANGPVTASDPLVGLPMPKASPAELDAHMLWNLRSGLNVAALKCQDWSGLMIIGNYNDTLRQHHGELSKAYTTLEGYFKRMNKKSAQQAFGSYNTRTYNGFSTPNGQKSFCHVAGKIARVAIATPKGRMLDVARAQLRELRASLVGYSDPFIRGTDTYRLFRPLPNFAPQCWKKNKYNAKKCG